MSTAPKSPKKQPNKLLSDLKTIAFALIATATFAYMLVWNATHR